MRQKQPSYEIATFDVWHDANGWHARFKGHLTDEALSHGVEAEVHAKTFAKLEIETMITRIAAGWYP